MTLKEAKEIFINRGYVPTNDGNNIIYDPDKWRNSVGVISRWLEKQPCEDAISRQAELALADGATNGDMIKAMFPQDIEIFGGYVIFKLGECRCRVAIDWWNALYKREDE